MNTPSIKTILRAFPHIDRATARAIKNAMIYDKEAPREWFSNGTRIARQMHAINELLQFHGVEYAASSEDDTRTAAGLEYCNAGDMYAATVIYDRLKGRFLIATVGDIIERNPRRFAE